jgi:pyruvate/2-oxoacid:ferredoxin oxidoreductase beta subunit
MGINLAEHYLNRKQLPHIWCAGCGNGIVLGALTRALADLGLDKRNVVVVTGIGCWGKADDYLNTNAFHGTHGRPKELRPTLITTSCGFIAAANSGQMLYALP